MIQARTNSKRLPNKVLATIASKPLIWYVINRIKHVSNIEQIILVTTTRAEDKILLDIAMNNKIFGFSGSVNNVLKRFYDCATKYNADPIIRITADCPLIDPKVVQEIVDFYLRNRYDYVSNTLIPTFPDGLDTEVFSFATLKKLFRLAKLPSEKEHVTSYAKNHPQEFRTFSYENKSNLSNYRWTVDEERDLRFVRRVYSLMKPRTIFFAEDLMKLLKKNPKLQEINAGLTRNEGYVKSLTKDKKYKES